MEGLLFLFLFFLFFSFFSRRYNNNNNNTSMVWYVVMVGLDNFNNIIMRKEGRKDLLCFCLFVFFYLSSYRNYINPIYNTILE